MTAALLAAALNSSTAATALPSPVASYDFRANSNVLPAGAALTRSSAATYQNKQGVYATAANNEPRIEWGLSSGTGTYCKGLLIEPASANLVKNSNDLTQATWGKSVVTVTGNGAAGPYGATDLAKLTNGTSNWNEVYQQIPVTQGNAYAITTHVRQGTLDKFIVVQMTELGPGYGATCFDIAAGKVGNKFNVDWTVQSASIEPMGDGGLFRITVVAVAGSTKTSNVGQYLQAINTDGTNFQADNGATGYVGHVQVEEIPAANLASATYPTSYILNTSGSASANRAADSVTVFFGAAAQSLTGNGTTATFTSTKPHGFTNGDTVTIAGATPSGFNGAFTITVTGANSFTYSSTASGTATGAVTAYYASKNYDIFVTDPNGSEWRKNVTVTNGTYTLSPRTQQRYVQTVRAWITGTLTAAQQNQIAGSGSGPVYLAPTGIGGPGVDKTTAGWTLTFLDDFEGVSRSDLGITYFDRTKWTSGFAPVVYGQDNGGDGSRFLGGNVEQQIYLDPDYAGNNIPQAQRLNPFVFDPKLPSIMRIKSDYIPENLQASYWAGGYRVFYSGLIDSCTKFSQQYGLFEAKIRMSPGLGAWPAFWLLPQTSSLATYVWPPEIDIFETFPKLRPTQVHQGIVITSGTGDGPMPQGWNNLPNNASTTDGFHIYSIEWNPTQITWYIDYQKIGSCATPASFTYPMYILVNCAIGGEWYRSESGAASGDYMALVNAYKSDTSQMPYYTDIDWVRVYTPGSVINPPPSPPAGSNESPNDTTIPPAASITDSKQGVWTVNNGVVYLNGATAAFTANVTLLLYHNQVIYQENSAGNWWSWNGTAWVQVAGDPRTSSGTSGSGAANIITIGDSITEGLLYAGAYRPALDSQLRGAGYSPTWIGRNQDSAGFHHEGYDGIGVQDPSGGIAAKVSGMALSSATHGMLLIGTNDISGYAPGSPVAAATEATRIGNLIDSIFAQNATLKLIVMNLTPRGDGVDVTPLNALIPNLVSQRASAGKNIIFCDVYTGYPTSNGYGTGDGDGALHPNQTGYNFMAQQLFTAFKKFGTATSGTTGGTATSPVAGYNTFVFGGSFGTSKTTSDAVTTVAGFSKLFGQKVFWQPLPAASQYAMQTDHIDLIAPDNNTKFFIESSFVFDTTKNYYVEGRFKIPTGVQNLVPAFWIYANSPDVIAGRNGGETNTSEVDIFETFYPVYGNQNQLFFTTHGPNHANIDQKIVDTGSSLAAKYTTVGCEVRLAAQQVVWWVNGVKQATFSYTWRSAPPAILLDIDWATLVGGNPPAAADMPQALSVDYLRVWSE